MNEKEYLAFNPHFPQDPSFFPCQVTLVRQREKKRKFTFFLSHAARLLFSCSFFLRGPALFSNDASQKTCRLSLFYLDEITKFFLSLQNALVFPLISETLFL
jgi:hypothetical protein